MTQLDTDSGLKTCTSAITGATASYAPGGSGGGQGTAAVSSALNNLCSSTSTTACSETNVRSTLAGFYSACQDELVNTKNEKVIAIYDTLYILYPFFTASCSKDDSGRYCATQIAGSPPAANSLYSTSGQQVLPSYSSLKSSNAAFLFITPSLASDALCTACTRSVLTAYVSFESDISYAPGLDSSVLLAGQSALYQAVNATCGSTFLSGVVNAGGALSGGVVGNSKKSGASKTTQAGAGGIAALIGAAAVVLAL